MSHLPQMIVSAPLCHLMVMAIGLPLAPQAIQGLMAIKGLALFYSLPLAIPPLSMAPLSGRLAMAIAQQIRLTSPMLGN